MNYSFRPVIKVDWPKKANKSHNWVATSTYLKDTASHEQRCKKKFVASPIFVLVF